MDDAEGVGSGAGGEDGEPEGNQDGDGHEEGHGRDAVAHGVDDPHGGEVGFLGRVETEERSATGPLRKGRLDSQTGDIFNSIPNLPVLGQGRLWGPQQTPSGTEAKLLFATCRLVRKQGRGGGGGGELDAYTIDG